MKRLSLTGLALIVCAGLLVACGGAPAPATPSPTAKPTATPTSPPPPSPTPTETPPMLLGDVLEEPLTPIDARNVRTLHEVARFGSGRITKIAYSPDGEVIAAASTLGVYLYDAETLEEGQLLETPSQVYCVAFNPDGSTLAAGLADGSVRSWNTTDWTGGDKLISTAPAFSVMHLAFAPDGSALMMGIPAKVSNIPLASSAQSWQLSGQAILPFDFALSPDGATLYSPLGLDTSQSADDLAPKLVPAGIGIYDAWSGALRRTISQGNLHTRLAVSPDGEYLAANTPGGQVVIWRTADDEVVHVLKDGEEQIGDIAFSQDGSLVSATGEDGFFRVWQVESGTLLHSIAVPNGDPGSIAFSPDGEWVAVSGGFAWTINGIEVYRVSDGEMVGRTTSRYWMRQPGETLAFSPDGALLAAGGSISPHIRVWDVTTGEELLDEGAGQRARLHPGGWVNGLAFSPRGDSFIASIGSSKVVEQDSAFVWRLSGRRFADEDPAYTVAINEDEELRLATYLPDGSPLVVVQSGDQADLMALRDNKWETVGTLDIPQDTIEAISPDGDLLLALDREDMRSEETEYGLEITQDLVETARLYRTSDPSWIGSLTGHEVRLNHATFSPDGTLLAAGCGEKGRLVCVWEVATQELLATLEGLPNEAKSVAFSPDGTLLAAGDDDGLIMLWGTADWELLFGTQGHAGGVAALAFSADGALLASGSWDGTVRLWAVALGDEITGQIERSLAPGESATDAIGDTGAAHADIVRVETRLTGTELQVAIVLRELSAELTFNRVGVPDHWAEYEWQVSIDVDADRQTGNDRGFDYRMAATHYVWEEDVDSPVMLPIEGAVQTDVWTRNPETESWTPLSSAAFRVDADNDAVILAGIVPGISQESRITVSTSDYLEGGDKLN